MEQGEVRGTSASADGLVPHSQLHDATSDGEPLAIVTSQLRTPITTYCQMDVVESFSHARSLHSLRASHYITMWRKNTTMTWLKLSTLQAQMQLWQKGNSTLAMPKILSSSAENKFDSI